MPTSGKLLILNLLTGQKSGFFALQVALVAPIHAKLCRANGHVGTLACAKFHLNCHREWECGPKISNISTFGKESPRRGDSLDRFRKKN